MMGALEVAEIEAVLKQGVVGRIGCHAQNRTYVVPVTYAYDGDSIYAHSAEGLKVHLMRANPEVCFEVDAYISLTNWRSVIAWGHFEELKGEEARRGMEILVKRVQDLTMESTDRLTHGMRVTADHAGESSAPAAVMYRLRLTEKTGRFERR